MALATVAAPDAAPIDKPRHTRHSLSIAPICLSLRAHNKYG